MKTDEQFLPDDLTGAREIPESTGAGAAVEAEQVSNDAPQDVSEGGDQEELRIEREHRARMDAWNELERNGATARLECESREELDICLDSWLTKLSGDWHAFDVDESAWSRDMEAVGLLLDRGFAWERFTVRVFDRGNDSDGRILWLTIDRTGPGCGAEHNIEKLAASRWKAAFHEGDHCRGNPMYERLPGSQRRLTTSGLKAQAELDGDASDRICRRGEFVNEPDTRRRLVVVHESRTPPKPEGDEGNVPTVDPPTSDAGRGAAVDSPPKHPTGRTQGESVVTDRAVPTESEGDEGRTPLPGNNAGAADEDQEFCFCPDGDGPENGFRIEAFGESGTVLLADAGGLRDIWRLLQSANSPVPMLELDAGQGTERLPGDARSRQKVADSETFESLRRRSAEIERDILDATTEAERERAERDWVDLEAASRKLLDKNGNPRDLNDPFGRLRSRIRKRLNKAYQAIAIAGLPTTSQHMKDAIAADNGHYVYRVEPNPPCWEFIKKNGE